MNLHPFAWIRESSRKAAFRAFAALALLAIGVLQLTGAPLKTNVSPAGIVSYELAGTTAAAEAILESWDANAETHAALNLGLDFLFIPAYSLAIGLGCVLVSEFPRCPVWMRRTGGGLAWAMPLAAALDTVENYALIRLLLGSRSAWLAPAARGCAIPKFLIVLIGLLYLVAGTIFCLARAKLTRRGDAA